MGFAGIEQADAVPELPSHLATAPHAKRVLQ
jgi:hypothetical protein